MTVNKKAKTTSIDLDSIGDLAGLLNEPTAEIGGGPVDLLMDLIDEDWEQPRKKDNPGFADESIGELAVTIKSRGVKSPISVREHPEFEGRYIINHGARRYRASIVAEKKSIPAFIDNDYSDTDQIIENLQRNGLTSREIAEFVGRELASGKKKREIAKDIGKSGSFVSQHVTLLDLPDPVAVVFNNGRVNDVTIVNELVTAYRRYPEDVAAWLLDEGQEITRGTVKLLREFLESRSIMDGVLIPSEDAFVGEVDDEGGEGEEEKTPREVDPSKLRKAIVQVEHDERHARLLLNRRPTMECWGWLKYEDDGEEFEVNLAEVRLIALMEG